MREGGSSRVAGGLGRASLVIAAACALGAVPACNNGPSVSPGVPERPGLGSETQSQHPFFGATVTLANAPPPVSGGTLLVLADGKTAVASDPDRDQVYVVDLANAKLLSTVTLGAGDEPGRVVEDAAGRAHVSLRGGGAVVTIDPVKGAVVDRQSVCPAPRGIAFDPASNSLYVACNGGELVTLPAAGGAPTRSLFLDTDLRDVVLRSGTLFVSRFRQAEVLEVDGAGNVARRFRPPVSRSGTEPDVAWRMFSAPASEDLSTPELVMVHQRARPTPVSVAPGGYGESSGGCQQTSIVETTVTAFAGNWERDAAPAVPAAVLPVDMAASPDGKNFAIVAAGNGKTPALPSVFFVARNSGGSISHPGSEGSGGSGVFIGGGAPCAASSGSAEVPGQATAVAFFGNDRVWVQTREPAALWLVETSKDAPGVQGPYTHVASSIVLSTVSREDTGHSIVHSNAGAFIACASCHAEGGEDGRVWRFQTTGGLTPARRTQSLRGTLNGTAPYHWEGDMNDISALAHEVFVKRMGGPTLAPDQATALQSWLFTVPEPRHSAIDPGSAARGKALFFSAEVGCAVCHNGPRYTNNVTVDVGTGGAFQVPSLIGVGWRAPYFHDGRAPELIDRFNPEIEGRKHGHTSQLSSAQIDDLVHFLQTL